MKGLTAGRLLFQAARSLFQWESLKVPQGRDSYQGFFFNYVTREALTVLDTNELTRLKTDQLSELYTFNL